MIGWLAGIRRFAISGRRKPEPPSADATAIVIGLIDSTVCLVQTLIGAGVLSREQVADAYRTAADQEAAQQPLVDPERRALAIRAISAFFSAPTAGDQRRLRLVVNNGTPDPAGKTI